MVILKVLSISLLLGLASLVLRLWFGVMTDEKSSTIDKIVESAIYLFTLGCIWTVIWSISDGFIG